MNENFSGIDVGVYSDGYVGVKKLNKGKQSSFKCKGRHIFTRFSLTFRVLLNDNRLKISRVVQVIFFKHFQVILSREFYLKCRKTGAKFFCVLLAFIFLQLSDV